MKQVMLTATQVRRNFFPLLKKVEEGEEVFFINKGKIVYLGSPFLIRIDANKILLG